MPIFRALPIAVLACCACRAAAFSPKLLVHISNHVPTSTARSATLLHQSSDGNKERDMMDEMNFFKADIPNEIQAEIFEAEAKTQAGQERAGRLANYAAIVVFGLGTAIFNTFLTGIQEDGSTLAEAGFGWVQSNPVNSFIFTSKIGGAIALVSAGLSAVMSEIELRGRRESVEKIWQEVQKRKEERERGGGRGKSKAQKKKGGKSKKKMQKQAKRLSALSEVMVDDDEPSPTPAQAASAETKVVEEEKPAEASKEEGGILRKMKGFYEKADSMAASQALLLNKELEDRGIVEKITDESGLKMIGRDAAAKLEKDADSDSKTKDAK